MKNPFFAKSTHIRSKHHPEIDLSVVWNPVSVTNYVDDWLGYASNFDELLRNFGEFLAVCLEHNITLNNTSKTKFGFPQAQFFGFKVDMHEGYSLSR